jgi:hypothetical protein
MYVVIEWTCCEYCKRGQEMNRDGAGCAGCGAPLPTPKEAARQLYEQYPGPMCTTWLAEWGPQKIG